MVGSFFSCLPVGTSLIRTLVQENTGGKTQLSAVITALVICIVLFWIGPVFAVLPRVKQIYVLAATLFLLLYL